MFTRLMEGHLPPRIQKTGSQRWLPTSSARGTGLAQRNICTASAPGGSNLRTSERLLPQCPALMGLRLRLTGAHLINVKSFPSYNILTNKVTFLKIANLVPTKRHYRGSHRPSLR